MLILDKGGGSGGGETATSVVTIESDPVTADTPEEFVYKRNVRRSIMYSNHSSNGPAQATNTGLDHHDDDEEGPLLLGHVWPLTHFFSVSFL